MGVSEKVSRPYEISSMFAVHAQIRAECLSDGYSRVDTIAPSQQLESELGYDIEVPTLKAVAFQFKRPYLLNDAKKRTYRTRVFKTTPPEDQLETLKRTGERFKRYGPTQGRCAFYAFPAVVSHGELENALERTVFVDAAVVPYDTTRLYIPPRYCRIPHRYQPPIEALVNGSKQEIDADAVYSWPRLYRELRDCDVGAFFRLNGGPVQDIQFRNEGEPEFSDHDYVPIEIDNSGIVVNAFSWNQKEHPELGPA